MKKPAGPEVWRAFGAIDRDARAYPDPLWESGWQSRNVTSVWRTKAGYGVLPEGSSHWFHGVYVHLVDLLRFRAYQKRLFRGVNSSCNPFMGDDDAIQ